MKKIVIRLSSVLLVGILFCVISQQVFAEESNQGIGFSVVPVIPSTQIDPSLGYYYLKTEPSKEQTFEVKLSSQKKEKQQIQLLVQDAYTGANGGLTYGINGEKEFKQDETLVNPTSEIVTPVTEVIELEPGEEKVVTFKVTPPKESYEGVKIGRLVFKSSEKDKSETQEAIIEEYQYAISIVLSENGDEYINGNLQELTLNEVKPTIKRGKRLVTANLQNPEPKRLMNLDMSATVTKKNSDKVIKETVIPDFQFAPNSNVDLEIDWGLSELAAGEYTLNISTHNSYDDIHLTKDFRITGEQAKKLNKESAFKIKTPTWVKVIAIFNGVLVVIISTTVILRNKKWLTLSRKKKKNKRKNKTK